MCTQNTAVFRNICENQLILYLQTAKNTLQIRSLATHLAALKIIANFIS